MTYAYETETEKRRSGRGAKVLIFGVAIFATLGAFWTVVWFIRSYVEQPRIAMRAPIALASKESEPAPAPKAPVRDPVATASLTVPVPDSAPPPQAAAAPPAPAAEAPAVVAQAAPAQPAAQPAQTGSISDRWFPTTPNAQWPDPPGTAATSQPVPAPTPLTAPAPMAATTSQAEQAAPETEQTETEVVVASMEPAIQGVVPKPRPKPPIHSASARLREPPVPRPRPEGSTTESVWTAVPTTDDRFPTAPSQ